MNAIDPYRIVLADDHAIFREGVKKILDGAEGIVVVGEAADGVQLLEMLTEDAPHLAIIDLSMPKLGGIEATREIKKNHSNVKTLILSMHAREEFLHSCLSAGADGYLLKDDTGVELLSAIEAIRRGDNYFSSCFSEEALDGATASGERVEGGAEPDRLTKREREVLTLIAEGKTSAEAAEILKISRRTVEHHRAGIAKRLGTSNLADQVKYAFRKGYVPEID
jgi:DNA-binding NarL/FixJ family response regulator